MSLAEKKKALIEHLISSGYLRTKPVIEAFRQVPRENFIPTAQKDYAYVDEPLPIGSGQTISAPHMVAIMTELLEPKKTDRVLEVGAGSGYQAAILSRLVKRIHTVELEPDLAKKAGEGLKKSGYDNVDVTVGDGSKGLPKEAPFDKIIVTCGATDIPKPLIEQLKEGGRIVIPVGSGMYQELILGVKRKGKLEKENKGACVFVPLRH